MLLPSVLKLVSNINQRKKADQEKLAEMKKFLEYQTNSIQVMEKIKIVTSNGNFIPYLDGQLSAYLHKQNPIGGDDTLRQQEIQKQLRDYRQYMYGLYHSATEARQFNADHNDLEKPTNPIDQQIKIDKLISELFINITKIFSIKEPEQAIRLLNLKSVDLKQYASFEDFEKPQDRINDMKLENQRLLFEFKRNFTLTPYSRINYKPYDYIMSLLFAEINTHKDNISRFKDSLFLDYITSELCSTLEITDEFYKFKLKNDLKVVFEYIEKHPNFQQGDNEPCNMDKYGLLADFLYLSALENRIYLDFNKLNSNP